VRALVLVSLAVALAFVGLMLYATDGHFVAQIADLHVVCQYAKAMAEGHPFRYNAGEAPTSGATSVLHTAILALGHALGARGEGLIALAILLGAAFYGASVLLARRVGARLGGEREGLLAGGLVALGGPVVWAFLYGSDIALFLGLIYLYATLHRTDYVMVAALAMMFSIMTSYTRARAESLIDRCKVGFMERPERIVLFMIGAFTDRMAGVLWVILVLSIVTVVNRMHFTYLALNNRAMPSGSNPAARVLWRAFFWRDERSTVPYDAWVIAILAFVWLTPPGWLGDPTAIGAGLWALLQ